MPKTKPPLRLFLTLALARQRKAKTIRYQWSNGNRLMLRPLTPALWKLVRKLGHTRASYRTFLAAWAEWSADPCYVATHQTGRLSLPAGRVWSQRFCLGVTHERVALGGGWWAGPHLARPEDTVIVLTVPLASLPMLTPPARSMKWAKEVAAFSSPEAKAWARKDRR